MPKIIGGTKEQREGELGLQEREAEMRNPKQGKLKVRSPILDVAQSALEAYAMGPGEYLKQEKQAGLAREEMAMRADENKQTRLSREVETGRELRARRDEGIANRLQARALVSEKGREGDVTADVTLYDRYTKIPAQARTKQQNDFIDAYLRKFRKGDKEDDKQKIKDEIENLIND